MDIAPRNDSTKEARIDVETEATHVGAEMEEKILESACVVNDVERTVVNLPDAVPTPNNIKKRTQRPLLNVEDPGTGKYMDPKLYWAATENDVNGFMDVNNQVLDSVTPLGNTLLHVVASYGYEETVRRIASHSPSLLTKQNSKGDTALHIAAKAGHASVVDTLLSHNGVTGRELDRLLRKTNDEENTALHEALINRQKEVAIKLIEADPEVIYFLNKEEKSALYLAAEAAYLECLTNMLKYLAANGNVDERLKGKPPVHAAVMGRNKGVLELILKEELRFIHLRDEEGRTPLHCAASIGYLEGVCHLLGEGKYIRRALERDNNGFFPIHMASIEGHVDVIKELCKRQHCPDPSELLDYNGQNILHVAAKSGKHKVVSYILYSLKTPKLEKLINEKDKDGNTPLHLATMQCHPKIVSDLTWDKRVDLKLTNKEGLTAHDAALGKKEDTFSFRQRLTWIALRAAGAPRAPLVGKVLNANRHSAMRLEPPNMDDNNKDGVNKNRQTAMRLEPPKHNMDNYKDRVNTLLLVSTLVATVTFAAGFTMPGGYNDSDPDQGMATMLRHKMFHIFVFSDMIAMYSSIIVAVTLIWAQLDDLKLVIIALELALPLLGIALTMMSLAFMASVFLVVSKLSWLANAILIMGSVFLVALSVLYFLLWFPISSKRCILRYISYYPFHLLIWATGSNTNGNVKE